MSSTEGIDCGGSAFPVPELRGQDGCGIAEGETGMSLRDYFAAKALQGILAGPASRDGASAKEWFDAPEIAYRLADAMISARKSPPPASRGEE